MSKSIESKMIEKAKVLLSKKIVTNVAGCKKGLFEYDVTPFIFKNIKQIEKDFVFNKYCGMNFSKFMVKENAKIETAKATINANNRIALQKDSNAKLTEIQAEKVLVFLKPCDTYSFNQLIKENRINRENFFIVGIPCVDFVAVTVSDDSTQQNERPLERCATCKSKKHVIFDELLDEAFDNAHDETSQANKTASIDKTARFLQVEELEQSTPEERYAFWRNELSRCIRCNACRNICPACTCESCVFDNPKSGIAQKAAADSFEENMFHIIRAFHVAGRCTDCGECSRVCPQNIPLHLLNRKFIKDINELYGEFQAGEDTETRSPLTAYTINDAEPSIVHSRSNNSSTNNSENGGDR